MRQSGSVAETRPKGLSIEGSSMSAGLLQLHRQQCNRTKAIAIRISTQRYISLMKQTQASANRSWMRCQRQGVVSLTRLQQPSTFAVLRSDEYRIYQQNVDLDAFFGAEQKNEKVSDICLLNDHFILVKMPEPTLLCTDASTTSAVPATSKNGSSKLARCFQCNRNSRISPVSEETVDNQSSKQQRCLAANTWTICDDDVEVFDSKTRILSATATAATAPASAAPSNGRFTVSVRPVIVQQPKRQSNKLQTAPSQLMELQLEAQQTLPTPAPTKLQPQSIRRTAFDWLLWPFRRRGQICAKHRPNATVHKTYFVRWTKPPDTLWHGYGVERSAAVGKVELRRCRSAVF